MPVMEWNETLVLDHANYSTAMEKIAANRT